MTINDTLLYKTVENPTKDGIYYITNNLSFPVQVVVTSRLNPETHSSLRILSNHADKKDVERFLAEAEKLSSPESLNNVDAVLQASVSANYDIYEEVRRDSIMCQALRELMKDEIETEINEAENRVKLEDIKGIMESFSVTAEQAMDALKIPQAKRAAIISKL